MSPSLNIINSKISRYDLEIILGCQKIAKPSIRNKTEEKKGPQSPSNGHDVLDISKRAIQKEINFQHKPYKCCSIL